MEIKRVLSHCDHTILAQTATWNDVKEVCDDAIKYNTATVCIPPCFVKRAKEYVQDKIKICTVIGFPNGYNTLETKVFETKNAIENGADEIDMVINIGDLKDKKYCNIYDEILTIKSICGYRVLKVIIETAFLTEEEKIKMCEIINEAHADYIKTSTGFAKSGATIDDIVLFKNHIDASIKIKAAGGIRCIKDAVEYINLGCDRIGASSIVKIIKEEKI